MGNSIFNWYGSGPKQKIAVIDLVEPDNYILAYLLARQCQKMKQVLHIICVGRPVDFSLPRWDPNSNTYLDVTDNKYKKANLNSELFQEIPYEERTRIYNERHSEALLRFNAIGLEKTLLMCGIARQWFILYHGGIASNARFSYKTYEFEDLFIDDGGMPVSYEIYQQKLVKLLAMKHEEMGEARLKRCTKLVKRHGRLLQSLDVLIKNLLCTPGDLQFFVNSPLTPFPKLLKLNLCKGEIRFIGPLIEGTKNVLGENFNVAADPVAYESTIKDGAFENMNFLFYAIETCKYKDLLKYTSGELADILIGKEGEAKQIEPLIQKMDLWTKCTNEKKMYLFAMLLYRDDPPFLKEPVTLKKIEDPQQYVCTSDVMGIKKHKYFAFMPKITLLQPFSENE